MTETTLLTRNLLGKAFDDPRLIVAFEQLQDRVSKVTDVAQGSTSAVDALNAAAVLVLTATTALKGARVLTAGSGVTIADAGGKVRVALDGTVPRVQGGRKVTFSATADTQLVLPPNGTLVTFGDLSPGGNYANDAAAAAGGVAVGRFYRNGSAMMLRVA